MVISQKYKNRVSVQRVKLLILPGVRSSCKVGKGARIVFFPLVQVGTTAPPPGFPAVSSKDSSGVSVSPKPHEASAPRLQLQSLAAGEGGRQGGARNKAKFVPLMSAEGRSKMAMHLPGRHACQCLAQKHALVNNCVECGRIVCAQVSTPPQQGAKISLQIWSVNAIRLPIHTV